MINYLLQQNRTTKQLIVLILDISIVIFSIWVSFSLRIGSYHYPINEQYLAYILAVVIAIPIFLAFRLYNEVFRYLGNFVLINIFRANILYFIIYLVSIMFLKQYLDISSSIKFGIPNSVILIQPFLLFIFMCLSRSLGKYIITESLIYRYKDKKNILIYGTGQIALDLSFTLINSRKYNIIGFLNSSKLRNKEKINSIKTYNIMQLPELIKKYSIEEIIIADQNLTQSERNKIINQIKKFGIHIKSIKSDLKFNDEKVNLKSISELESNDLLGRNEIKDHSINFEASLKDVTILVTGAGGSIGGEICKQLINNKVKELIILDHNEFALYEIEKKLLNELKDRNTNILIYTVLADVKNKESLIKVFETYKIDVVYHAAAYKHVPIVEKNKIEGLRNNVFGTKNIAEISQENNIKSFTLVSTDKAVRPSNVMGVSKRIAEMIVQSLAEKNKNKQKTIFSIVRFGNVLDSNGSVIPLFREQIIDNGPITITHKDVTRFFMTIPEAAQLVIESSLLASGGEIFLLNMGKPIKILDLAKNMIELSGLKYKDENNPEGDISIEFIGLKPGEKLFEELLIDNKSMPTTHPKINYAHESYLPIGELKILLDELMNNLDKFSDKELTVRLKKIVKEYQ